MVTVKFRFFSLFAAVTSAAFAQPRPLAGNPGNVFLRGQEITVGTSAAEDVKWVCVDYDGKEMAKGTGPMVKRIAVHSGWR